MFFVTVNHYFIVEYVGRTYILHCPINGPNITSVGVTVNGLVLIPDQPWNQTELLVEFQPLKDSYHGNTYSCHGNRAGSLITFNFTIVAIGKVDDVLTCSNLMFYLVLVSFPTLNVSFPILPAILSGDPVIMRCVVTETVPGLTGRSKISWVGPDGGLVANGNGITVTVGKGDNDTTSHSMVSLTAANTSSAGIYTCTAELTTVGFHISPLFAFKEEILHIQSKFWLV